MACVLCAALGSLGRAPPAHGRVLPDPPPRWTLRPGQTEGSKRWSIYRPTEGPYAHRLLANHCSGDLEEALLGPPLMEFILEVGGGPWVLLWGGVGWRGSGGGQGASLASGLSAAPG